MNLSIRVEAKTNALITESCIAIWSGGWLTAHQLFTIRSSEQKNGRWLAFCYFCSYCWHYCTKKCVGTDEETAVWRDLQSSSSGEYVYGILISIATSELQGPGVSHELGLSSVGFHMSSLYIVHWFIFSPHNVPKYACSWITYATLPVDGSKCVCVCRRCSAKDWCPAWTEFSHLQSRIPEIASKITTTMIRIKRLLNITLQLPFLGQLLQIILNFSSKSFH